MLKSERRASRARFVSTTTHHFRDWAHVWPSGPSGPMFVERLQIFARCLRMVVAGSTDIVASANFGRATATPGRLCHRVGIALSANRAVEGVRRNLYFLVDSHFRMTFCFERQKRI